jgi:magnesium transporter
MFISPEGRISKDLGSLQISTIVRSGEGLLWVDFENTPPERDEPFLREVFGFHPLAIDDALQEAHVPKLDDWGDYLYIVLYAFEIDQHDHHQLQTYELDIFAGFHYLVTHHDQSIAALNRVWDSLEVDPRYKKNDADRLLYHLVDEIVADYLPVVEQLEMTIDETQDEIFSNPGQETLTLIFTMKRNVLHLRRVLNPQREVLNKLARDELQVIDARTRVYFRDVYDHLVRMTDIMENVRDLVSSALDTYLSVINNRMNNIMKTLTVITTLFMPISFIASFFGMNFFQPVARLHVWTSYTLFLITLGVIILLPIGMYTWLRMRNWL